MRNIELKARLADRDHAEACCENLGAAFQGNIHQVDTYFRVHEGRLKLREKDPGGSELIFYRREDVAEAQASDYYLAPASPELKALLTNAFGVIAVVDKVRSLWFWENVRIHLDRVQGLGDFIEFEAVLSNEADDQVGFSKVQMLNESFQISEEMLQHGSYLDLVLNFASKND